MVSFIGSVLRHNATKCMSMHQPLLRTGQPTQQGAHTVRSAHRGVDGNRCTVGEACLNPGWPIKRCVAGHNGGKVCQQLGTATCVRRQ